MKQLLDALNQTKAKNDDASQTAILDMLREWKGMSENLLGSLGNWVTDIEKRESNLNAVIESLEIRFKDLEKKERDSEGKNSEVVLKEGELGTLLKDFTKEVELKEERLDEQLKKVSEHIKSLEIAQTEVQALKLRQIEKLKEIERKEREVDSLHGSLEERLREVEEREKGFYSFHDEKLKELIMREEVLSKKKKEFAKEVKLTDEKFSEGKKMGCGLIKNLESALSSLDEVKATVDQRFEEIESREAAACGALIAVVNEAELIREQLEERLEEFEKMLREFSLYQEEKMRKLELKDQNTSVIREELLQELKLMDEKVAGQQKLGEVLSERLEELMAKKLDEMGSLQLTLNVTSETFRAQDSDANGELVDVRLQELEQKEDEFYLFQEKKERELESNEKKLRLIMEEFIQEVKYREEKFDEQEKMFYGLLKRLEMAQSKIEDMNKMLTERFKQISLKEGEFCLVEGCTEPVGLADLNQPVDVERLEMAINNTEIDLELRADEVSEVLRQSPDPAKLVLIAIERFCTQEGDGKVNTRRTHILLLDHLTKRSSNIRPCVRDAAIKLAIEWKSKMKSSGQNTLQVLEFLHLLAAYKLSSLFDKEELLILLKAVAQQEQTPELIRILDLTDRINVFVQSLLNERQYLLASAYIEKFELDGVFPQTAIIDFYVKHVKMLGKAKVKDEHDCSEVKVLAIFEEIADLRRAIEHIVKHGLGSSYSPDIVMERIKQLESDLTNLKNGIVLSVSTGLHRQGKGERSSGLQDTNKRNAQQNLDKAAEEDVPIANALLPEQGSDQGTPSGWKNQYRKNKTKKRRASQSFHKPMPQEENGNVQFRHPSGHQTLHPSEVDNRLFRHQPFHVPEAEDNGSFRHPSGSQPFHLPEVVDNGPFGHPSGSRKRHRRYRRDVQHHGLAYEHQRFRH